MSEQNSAFQVRRDGNLYVFQHGYWHLVDGFYFRPMSMAYAKHACKGNWDKHPDLSAVVYPITIQR